MGIERILKWMAPVAAGLCVAGCNMPAIEATQVPPPEAAIIRGTVWHDRCDSEQTEPSEGCVPVEGGGYLADGLRGGDEPGIEGIEVELGTGACPSSGTDSTVSGADGSYAFIGHGPDTYCVSIDTQSATNLDRLNEGNWTRPAEGDPMITIEVVAGQDYSELDFGWDYRTPLDGTPAAEPSLVTAVGDANCRRGPGTMYDAIGYLLEGESAVARGRNSDSTWWWVNLSEHREACWVSHLSVNINFDPEDLPALQVPPTPTPAAGAIAGSVWHDMCSLANGNPSPGCLEIAGGGFRGNGLREQGEPGLGGVLINLGSGACPSAGLASTISEDEGRYRFAGLAEGMYCVSIDALGAVNGTILVPGEWTQPRGEAQAGLTIMLAPNEEHVAADFGWDYQFLP